MSERVQLNHMNKDKIRKKILDEFLCNLRIISDKSYQKRIWIEAKGPEVHHLVTQWDTIPCDIRGELAGHAFGKYGADNHHPRSFGKSCR